jgi:acetyltransferase-like isoleucine patch superfamily enzyme
MTLPGEFFQLGGWSHRALFDGDGPVWTALDRLEAYLAGFFAGDWPLRGRTGLVGRTLAVVDGVARDDVELRPGRRGLPTVWLGERRLEGAAIVMAGAYLYDDRILLGRDTVVEPGAMIKGPAVFGSGTEVRQGAYVRGNCLIGDGCVVGHATEVKTSVFLDGAKAGHFAYVGDSILGRDANLGAGTKLANLRMIPGTIAVRIPDGRLDTGRRKLGAILGDGTEIGCNAVTSPGTLIGPRSMIYPAVAVPAGLYGPATLFRPARGSLLIRPGTP